MKCWAGRGFSIDGSTGHGLLRDTVRPDFGRARAASRFSGVMRFIAPAEAFVAAASPVAPVPQIGVYLVLRGYLSIGHTLASPNSFASKVGIWSSGSTSSPRTYDEESPFALSDSLIGIRSDSDPSESLSKGRCARATLLVLVEGQFAQSDTSCAKPSPNEVSIHCPACMVHGRDATRLPSISGVRVTTVSASQNSPVGYFITCWPVLRWVCRSLHTALCQLSELQRSTACITHLCTLLKNRCRVRGGVFVSSARRCRSRFSRAIISIDSEYGTHRAGGPGSRRHEE